MHGEEALFENELLQTCLKQLKTDGDVEQEEELSWTTKPLHGMYYQQREEVADIKKSYQWLQQAMLGYRRCSFIC